MKIGVIGGSGLYDIDGLSFREEVPVQTKWGVPSAPYRKFIFGDGLEVYFLARHGAKHEFAPHTVNYRANIAGFKELGVSRIIAFTATGGINHMLRPGDVVIPDNAIDFTSGRPRTFFDEGDIYHIDLTEPFCPDLRSRLIASADHANIRYMDNGTYITTNGPRLETAAEIRMMAGFGADLVGMTMFPEVALAREAELCYANVSIITNYGAGTTKEKLTSAEVVQVMKESEEHIRLVLSGALSGLGNGVHCDCGSALADQKISK